MEQLRFRNSLPSRRSGKWRTEDIASTAPRVRTGPNHPGTRLTHRVARAGQFFRFSWRSRLPLSMWSEQFSGIWNSNISIAE